MATWQLLSPPIHPLPQVSSIAALSLALVYQGTANGDAVEAILQVGRSFNEFTVVKPACSSKETTRGLA